MPPFACHDPEQSQESISKVLEICMSIQAVLKFYIGKNCDPQDRKNVQDKSEEHSNIGQFWNSIYESLENLLQSFRFSDNFEHSRNSKRANNCGQGHKIDVEEVIKGDADKGRDHNKEIKYVPSIVKVVQAVSNQLNDHLKEVDCSENKVKVGENGFKRGVLDAVEVQRKGQCVQTDYYKDCRVKNLTVGNLTTRVPQTTSFISFCLLGLTLVNLYQNVQVFCLQHR